MRARATRNRSGIQLWRPPRVLLMSWLGLLALLAVTVSAAYVPAGALNTPLALVIAAAKAALVAIIFMELRDHKPLVIVFACAGFYWLAIMLWLTFADVLTRPNSPPFGSLF